MKNRYTIAIVCLVLGALALSGVAFGHGTEKHGKTAPADAQMKKLHAMMPMFSIASAKLEAALEKGDAAAAESEAHRIVVALPDLKKSRPHKNFSQKKKFVDLANSLGTAVNLTTELAKKDDFAGAMGAFKKVEQACMACHAMFRD
ncbi:MAG TPA: cytochrome c [Desulfuromonadaceae bacterium]|jgi:cytochrome c556